MFVEIEESVCFLATFLYGSIPRCRVETLSECLANELVQHFYVSHSPSSHLSLSVNIDGRCDNIVHNAARQAFIDLPQMLSLFPANLILEISENTINAVNGVTGHVKSVYPNLSIYDSSRRARVRTNRRPRLRLHFVLTPTARSSYSIRVPKPHFEVARQCDLITSRAFAATRFGSTKLKTNQQCERGDHPFTMPSLYAYLQLLVFLNSVSCAQVATRTDFDKEEEDIDSIDSGLFASSLAISNLSSSYSTNSDSLLEQTDSGEDLLKCCGYSSGNGLHLMLSP